MQTDFEHGFIRAEVASHAGYVVPPGEILLLHRKLGGMFLLCVRLKARIDTRALLVPVLDGVERN